MEWRICCRLTCWRDTFHLCVENMYYTQARKRIDEFETLACGHKERHWGNSFGEKGKRNCLYFVAHRSWPCFFWGLGVTCEFLREAWYRWAEDQQRMVHGWRWVQSHSSGWIRQNLRGRYWGLGCQGWNAPFACVYQFCCQLHVFSIIQKVTTIFHETCLKLREC